MESADRLTLWENRKMIATINPSNGLIEAEFEAHSPAQVEERISSAYTAAQTLRSTTFSQRSTWLNIAADLLLADIDKLSRLITIEMGKPIIQSRAEVEKCVKSMRYYAKRAEEFLTEAPLLTPSDVGASRAWTKYEPLGVVLAVMPWNYPLWQVMRFAAPALMAGNAGLLKHASNVPQSALYLEDLFLRAGFPLGSFNSLLISGREVEAVLRDSRIKAVTLTGSEPAGRSVAAIAGDVIKKSVLELGGSDPFIVMPSANLELAAEIAVRARINNNGQSCIAGKRFIIHEQVFDEFLALFRSNMAALKVGDPLDETTEVGPLATAGGLEELSEIVDDARSQGATIVLGGTRLDRPGFFYEPTIVTDITSEMRIMAEETFGPVASVYKANSPEHACEIANQTRFGLSSAVWSQDESEQEWFISALDAGAVFVNGMTVSYSELPFGGIKASGFGRELADIGIREFCNLKTVWKA